MAAIIISNQDRSQPIYGFDQVTDAAEVSLLIDRIRENMGLDKMNKVRIFILSGTHGDSNGNLVGEKIFFLEDKSKELQTVTAVNVNERTSSNTWRRYFRQKKSIIILAWCFSSRWSDFFLYNQ